MSVRSEVKKQFCFDSLVRSWKAYSNIHGNNIWTKFILLILSFLIEENEAVVLSGRILGVQAYILDT